MITTYKQALTFLESFINYEQCSYFPYSTSLKSQRMKFLVDSLKLDIGKLKVIHIAGTKGKGSTSWFCAHMLAGCGYKVGIYTSPHLHDFRERIQIVRGRESRIRDKKIIQKRLIPKKDVVEIVNKVQRILKGLPVPKELGKVSFFEVYTAIAFIYFLKEKVDFAVIETGLGGRLDATNVITPLVSVITHIGYDHTAQLGKDLASIAGEKAGIIKEASDVVCSKQVKSVLAVIKRAAAGKHSRLFALGRDFHISRLSLEPKKTLFDFSFKGILFKGISLRLRGAYQAENAACALAALCLLREKGLIGADKFYEYLDTCIIAGRFQTIAEKPLIVVDVAHNKSSFRALKKNIEYYYPALKIILIFGCSRDKDFKTMLSTLNTYRLILTSFKSPRAADPHSLLQCLKQQKAIICKSLPQAFRRALALASKDTVIVISGSLYLVAQALEMLERRAVFSKNLK